MSIQALAFHAEENGVNPVNPAAGGQELAMPPLAFGIVALCILLGMLLITFGFRNIGQRH